MDFEGFPVILNDTAGIRSAKSEVEKIGIERALEKAKISDLILVLSDNEDFSYPELETKGKKILVHTKSDLGTVSKKNIYNISVKKNVGIDKLIKAIVKHLKFEPKRRSITNKKKTYCSGVKFNRYIE